MKGVYHNVRKANVLVTKDVNITKDNPDIYIDDKIELQGKLYQLTKIEKRIVIPLGQSRRSERLVESLVRLENRTYLFYISSFKLKSGICYNQAVSKEELKITNNEKMFC